MGNNTKTLKIFITDDLIVDFDDGKVISNKSSNTLSPQECSLLKLLVDNANHFVSREVFEDALWGNDEKGGTDDTKNAIQNLVKSIKKKDTTGYFKANIKPKYGTTSYRLTIDDKYLNRYRRGLNPDYDLVGCISSADVLGINKEDVLFRNIELSKIRKDIESGKHFLLLTGMGGVGKTTIARRLYFELKDSFDCYGWFNYSGDISQSIISSIILEDEQYKVIPDDNPKEKWNYIIHIFSKSRSRKLLVFDNVDYIDQVQDPLIDQKLAGITGWDNVTVIITSRIPSIIGYSSTHEIRNLGNIDNPSKCVELFYHYNESARSDRDNNEEIVIKLCEMASFNTFVIELLAKTSSFYGPSGLASFYKGLIKKKFRYVDEIPVASEHGSMCSRKNSQRVYSDNTASDQLITLFNMHDRDPVESEALWFFAHLPEAERVSHEELHNWMGYSLKAIKRLIDEGWIKMDNGYYYIHPLVQQAVLCNESDYQTYLESASQRRKSQKDLVSEILDHNLYSDLDPFILKSRKLMFADSLTFSGKALSIEDCLYVADLARKASIRAITLRFYEQAYFKSKELEFKSRDLNDICLLWKSAYFYGYVLSYSKAGYEKAEALIAESLDIISGYQADKKDKEYVQSLMAMSYDHLGYVICRNNENKIDRITKADQCLNYAIYLRKTLSEMHPDNSRYLHDYAWSLDNLGSMYASIDPDKLEYKKQKDYLSYDDIIKEKENATIALQDALIIRRKNNDPTEVAWTLCNLAAILSDNPASEETVRQSFEEALDIYHKLDQLYPGQHMGSEAKTCLLYAEFLQKSDHAPDLALEYFKRALELNETLEHDYPGVYTKEVETSKEALDHFQFTFTKRK